METKNNIPSDEVLAAYMDGRCDEAERNAVERWLEDNPEAADELLNITMAAAVQRRRANGVSGKIFFRPMVWAAAASVALVLVVGGLLLLRNDDDRVSVAQLRTDDTVLRMMPMYEPTETTESQDIGETGNPAVEQALRPLRVQREERSTAAEAVAPTALTMRYPRREREVVEAGGDITFIWDSELPSLMLAVTDGEERTLLRTKLPGSGSYRIPAARLQGADRVQWEMTSAGGAKMRSGVIDIVSE